MKEFKFQYLKNVRRDGDNRPLGTLLRYGIVGEDDNVQTQYSFEFNFAPNEEVLVPVSSVRLIRDRSSQKVRYEFIDLVHNHNHFEKVSRKPEVDDEAMLLVKLLRVLAPLRGTESDVFPSNFWEAYEHYNGAVKGFKQWFKMNVAQLRREKYFDDVMSESELSGEKSEKLKRIEEKSVNILLGKKDEKDSNKVGEKLKK